jgi:DNA primase
MLRSRSAVLVEGCMDAVIMSIFGINNCVSLLGTKLTPIHESLLRRFSDHLVFCFDSDQAGEKTRSNVSEAFGDYTGWKNYEMTTSAVVLREGTDPENALTDDAERPLLLFYLNDLCEKQVDQRVINLDDDGHRAAARWQLKGSEND